MAERTGISIPASAATTVAEETIISRYCSLSGSDLRSRFVVSDGSSSISLFDNVLKLVPDIISYKKPIDLVENGGTSSVSFVSVSPRREGGSTLLALASGCNLDIISWQLSKDAANEGKVMGTLSSTGPHRWLSASWHPRLKGLLAAICQAEVRLALCSMSEADSASESGPHKPKPRDASLGGVPSCMSSASTHSVPVLLLGESRDNDEKGKAVSFTHGCGSGIVTEGGTSQAHRRSDAISKVEELEIKCVAQLQPPSSAGVCGISARDTGPACRSVQCHVAWVDDAHSYPAVQNLLQSSRASQNDALEPGPPPHPLQRADGVVTLVVCWGADMELVSWPAAALWKAKSDVALTRALPKTSATVAMAQDAESVSFGCMNDEGGGGGSSSSSSNSSSNGNDRFMTAKPVSRRKLLLGVPGTVRAVSVGPYGSVLMTTEASLALSHVPSPQPPCSEQQLQAGSGAFIQGGTQGSRGSCVNGRSKRFESGGNNGRSNKGSDQLQGCGNGASCGVFGQPLGSSETSPRDRESGMRKGPQEQGQQQHEREQHLQQGQQQGQEEGEKVIDLRGTWTARAGALGHAQLACSHPQGSSTGLSLPSLFNIGLGRKLDASGDGGSILAGVPIEGCAPGNASGVKLDVREPQLLLGSHERNVLLQCTAAMASSGSLTSEPPPQPSSGSSSRAALCVVLPGRRCVSPRAAVKGAMSKRCAVGSAVEFDEEPDGKSDFCCSAPAPLQLQRPDLLCCCGLLVLAASSLGPPMVAAFRFDPQGGGALTLLSYLMPTWPPEWVRPGRGRMRGLTAVLVPPCAASTGDGEGIKRGQEDLTCRGRNACSTTTATGKSNGSAVDKAAMLVEEAASSKPSQRSSAASLCPTPPCVSSGSATAAAAAPEVVGQPRVEAMLVAVVGELESSPAGAGIFGFGRAGQTLGQKITRLVTSTHALPPGCAAAAAVIPTMAAIAECSSDPEALLAIGNRISAAPGDDPGAEAVAPEALGSVGICPMEDLGLHNSEVRGTTAGAAATTTTTGAEIEVALFGRMNELFADFRRHFDRRLDELAGSLQDQAARLSRIEAVLEQQRQLGESKEK